ncbi:hypothetical protein [Oceanobacillus oncorhynchi]|uniref:hypothetical protein n=1 Tax=Oceanobacillus oncorhynchi TaxID=545501 RepID=UPI0018663BF4|nr:hypothetical protein [Oceanobacillus oncorhynchi]
MQNLINQVKEVRDFSQKIVNIPFSYIIFLAATLLLWKPKYIEIIDASRWVPDDIRFIILDLFNSIYSNLWAIQIGLLIVLIILIVLSEKHIFEFILPKDIFYKDDTVDSWNEFTAIGRLIRIMISLVTTCWIYYFAFNILFNEHNFAQNFLLRDSHKVNNELIDTKYLTLPFLEMMNGIFWLNILFAIYFIVRAIFVLRMPSNKDFLRTNEVLWYPRLNSFQHKNSMGELFETSIYKRKSKKSSEFLLVKAQCSKYGYHSNGINKDKFLNVKKIPANNRSYKIINHSESLSEITYHFDSLKNELQQDND